MTGSKLADNSAWGLYYNFVNRIWFQFGISLESCRGHSRCCSPLTTSDYITCPKTCSFKCYSIYCHETFNLWRHFQQCPWESLSRKGGTVGDTQKGMVMSAWACQWKAYSRSGWAISLINAQKTQIVLANCSSKLFGYYSCMTVPPMLIQWWL